ncbi:MAG: DUF4249 domain-containing protein [Bacteroidetes bacterium]|nr:DUF4249 domain-containing protein [Bacteroidota bacterium]
MKFLKYILLIPLIFLFSSCEDVIKVNVKQGEPKLVVDAFVNNLPRKQLIRLTRSNPYFATPGTEPAVTGATVAILDTSDISNPKLFVFADSGNGNYIFKPNPSTGDTFTVGRNYALVVIDGTDTLMSLSRLNPTAKIDSLHLQYEDGTSSAFKKGKYVEMKANDLTGAGNYYWIKTYNNDTFLNRIFDINISEDMGATGNSQDGGEFIWPVRYGALNDFQKPRTSGAKVRVELHSISRETYFWFNLVINENQNGGLFATPPANIGTNLFPFNPAKKIPVAGFFCMSAVSVAEVVIP